MEINLQYPLKSQYLCLGYVYQGPLASFSSLADELANIYSAQLRTPASSSLLQIPVTDLEGKDLFVSLLSIEMSLSKSLWEERWELSRGKEKAFQRISTSLQPGQCPVMSKGSSENRWWRVTMVPPKDQQPGVRTVRDRIMQKLKAQALKTACSVENRNSPFTKDKGNFPEDPVFLFTYVKLG